MTHYRHSSRVQFNIITRGEWGKTLDTLILEKIVLLSQRKWTSSSRSTLTGTREKFQKNSFIISSTKTAFQVRETLILSNSTFGSRIIVLKIFINIFESIQSLIVTTFFKHLRRVVNDKTHFKVNDVKINFISFLNYFGS